MVNPDRNLYDPPYDDALLYDTDLEPERPRSRPLFVMLGFVVLAAFAGVVWVAYNQGIQQGKEGPPLLAADRGPTRIVPDDGAIPDVAPDKGYDRLAGDGLVPDTSAPLPKATASREAIDEGEALGGPFLSDRATDMIAPGSADPAEPGLDDSIGVTAPKAAAPLPPLQQKATPASPVTPQQLAQSAPRQVPPRTPAPKTQVPAEVQPASPALPPPQAIAPPPDSLAAAQPVASGVMIQLGSFPDAGLAAAAWTRIMGRHQQLLADLKPLFQRATIDGKTWYRLRVNGFADKSSAQDVCRQLDAAGQDCIVAVK